MHFQTIYSTVRATRGIKKPEETTNRGGFVAFVNKLFGNLPWYEYVWYAVFVVAGILCLSLFKFSAILLVSVISLYVYMIASNLQARGSIIGLYFSIASTGIYVAVCIVTRVWGEVISNVLIYLPLTIIALVKWNKLATTESQNELKVTKFGLSDWWFTIGFVGTFSIASGIFLDKVMGQSYATINAFSIYISLAGDFARNNGKREAWLLYMISNILAVVLWVLVSVGQDWSTIPYIVSSFAGLFNSIIGMIEWQKLLQKNHKTTGDYLAKANRKKVNSIIRLRRQMQNLKWVASTDENWKNRYKNYKKVRPRHK